VEANGGRASTMGESSYRHGVVRNGMWMYRPATGDARWSRGGRGVSDFLYFPLLNLHVFLNQIQRVDDNLL